MNQLILKAEQLYITLISSKEFDKPETRYDELSRQKYATGNTLKCRVSNFWGKTQESKGGKYEEKGFRMTYWGEENLYDGWYKDCTIRIINKKTQVKSIDGSEVEVWTKEIELIDYKKSPIFDIERTKKDINDIRMPKAPEDLIDNEEVISLEENDAGKLEWFDE